MIVCNPTWIKLFNQYVQRLYNLILNRPPVQSEIDYWSNQLLNSSPESVIRRIEYSSEALNILIGNWYTTFLGRTASPTEIDFWVSVFTTEENILSQILGTIEFYNYAQTIVSSGTPDQRFITALYNLVLQRGPDSGGLIFWINNIGLGHAIIALYFLKSLEYRKLIINDYYSVILNRSPSTNELNNFVQSSYDLLTIKIRLKSGTEYIGKRFVVFYNGRGAIYLPSPEFDNSNKISLDKINRRSRGGDIIVFRDNQWPKNETFDLTWSSLDQQDSNNLLHFLQITLGQLVTYIDYENRRFDGIITAPEGVVSQTTISRFSAQLQFTATQ